MITGFPMVLRRNSVRLIDNWTGKEVDIIPQESGIPIASSLATGHVHQAEPNARCPDCILLNSPQHAKASSRDASSLRHKQLILEPICDSTLEGSCDCGATAFLPGGCCDLATGVGCDGYGYYDGGGNWIVDPCADYLYDATYYDACVAANSGAQLAAIPTLIRFRSPDVQHYNWYFDTYTVMDVTHASVSNLVLTFNWSMNDLFSGRIFLQNIPMSPGAAGFSHWCFYLNNTSAFNSSTVWVNDPSNHQVGAWSATLADVAGLTNPNKCPL